MKGVIDVLGELCDQYDCIWLKKKKKENENKFGEEKMLRKSKEKEGKGKELGVVMELNRRENTKEKVLFDLFYFIKKKKN